ATIQLDRPFATMHVTNPEIVDILPLSDRAATLVPKTGGITSVDIVDDKATLVSSLIVRVTPANFAPPVPVVGRVEVHNNWAHIGSSTVYLCGLAGCQFVHEEELKAAPPPIPQPARVTNNSVNVVNRSGPGFVLPPY